MSEGMRIRANRRFARSQGKAQAPARHLPKDGIDPVRLFRVSALDAFASKNAIAVLSATSGESAIQRGERTRRRVAVGRRHLGLSPLAAVYQRRIEDGPRIGDRFIGNAFRI